MIFQTLEYIKYLLRCFHLHGIHSPFVFDFQKNIIKSKEKFYLFDDINSIRAKLLLSNQTISVEDFGAGSKKLNSNQRAIKDIAKTATKKSKEGELLFKIVNRFKPTNLLELGSCLGISTAYIAGPSSNSKLISLEGSESLCSVAKLNLEKLRIKNVEIIGGEFSSTLDKALIKLEKLDFVFFDGNHRYSPTIEYFEKCLPLVHDQTIFVFDDIYWSKDMSKAWQEIKSNKLVSVTIDLYHFGIVFFKKDQKKQDFTVYHG